MNPNFSPMKTLAIAQNPGWLNGSTVQPNHLKLKSSLYDLVDPTLTREDSIWKSFLEAHPVIKFLRPDFYLIFLYADNCKILYQENINLDLGGPEVNFEHIMQAYLPADRCHIKATDQIMLQLIHERQLQPWDYTYKICGNVSCPNTDLKRLMRSSILIHRDQIEKVSLGFMCFHNVTGMVSSIRPNSFDISFGPDLEYLNTEIEKRLSKTQGIRISLSKREEKSWNAYAGA